MKATYFFLIALLCLPGCTPTYGQKLSAEGYEISIDNWEVRKTKDFFGETQSIYLGAIKVKKDNKRWGTFRFYLPERDGKASHLTITTKGDDIMEPRLYINSENQSFIYHKGEPNEGRAPILKNGDPKDLVLSGMLVWLKHQPD